MEQKLEVKKNKVKTHNDDTDEIYTINYKKRVNVGIHIMWNLRNTEWS